MAAQVRAVWASRAGLPLPLSGSAVLRLEPSKLHGPLGLRRRNPRKHPRATGRLPSRIAARRQQTGSDRYRDTRVKRSAAASLTRCEKAGAERTSAWKCAGPRANSRLSRVATTVAERA